MGFTADPRGHDYSAYLTRFFRPEFLNRVDETITFRALTPQALDTILAMQLSDLHRRLADQHLTLTLSDAAQQLILARGYDPENGARPLRRAIERLLTRPLSARIVEDAFAPGALIQADVVEERLVFAAAPAHTE
jgi:ATP-dependent Clp protease ATP-binding subunit ClpA